MTAELKQGFAVKACQGGSNRPIGLFVVFHGIWPTIFESQVLIHVQEMRNLGIHMEVWVFPLSRANYAASALHRARLEQKYGVPIRLFQGYNPRLPFASILNALLLTKVLHRSTLRPEFIHARTDYSTMVCGLVRMFFPFELIWDCRGDAVAEFGMSKPVTGMLARFMQFAKMRAAAVYRAAARRFSTRAIFVSELLRDRCLPKSSHRIVEVVPCCASERAFFFSSSLRQVCRERMSIDADQLVLIFAGSITPYQCFPEAVNLFRSVVQRDPRAVFLVITPNQEEAQDALRILPSKNYRLFSAAIDRVNEYLNGADFGVFLRERNTINDVASPVKFAEYCLAGLPVIMTDAVAQATEYGRRLGNAIEVELGSAPTQLERWSDGQRAVLAKMAIPLLGRSAATTKYFHLYQAGKGFKS